jgi:hypothetical protein
MPLQIVDDAGNAVALPKGVTLEKVEDITTLADKAKKHDELDKRVKELDGDPDYKNWKNTRQIITDKDAKINQLTEQLNKLGGNQPQPGEPVKVEQAEQVVEKILNRKESAKIDKRVERIIDEAAGGDDSRKKVIKEKFDSLKGGRELTSEEEADGLLNDAIHLANKNRESGYNPFDAISRPSGGGSTGGGPAKGNGEDKAKAVSNLQAMGYRFKGDPKKYTQ